MTSAAIVGSDHWSQRYFHEQLAPFRQSGISTALLDATRNFFGAVFYDSHFARFSVAAGSLSHRAAYEVYPDYIRERFDIMSRLFADLAAELPDLSFDIYLGDGFTGWSAGNPAPVFAFSKHRTDDPTALVLPDPMTLGSAAALRSEVASGNARYEWPAKIAKAFWRGSTTGDLLAPENYRQNVRFRLVEVAARYPDEIDARFTGSHPSCSAEAWSQANASGFVGEPVPISEHMRFRYLVLVDGFTSPWQRYFWCMHANSTIFKQDSNIDAWFDSQCTPMVHYIPVASDFGDLPLKVMFARNNDGLARQIAANANEFARGELTDERVRAFVLTYLQHYGSLFRT
jgi:hypothetical protein